MEQYGFAGGIYVQATGGMDGLAGGLALPEIGWVAVPLLQPRLTNAPRSPLIPANKCRSMRAGAGHDRDHGPGADHAGCAPRVSP